MVDTEVGRPMVVTNWGKCYCQASRGTKVEVWISETQADYVGRRWQVEVLNANVLMHVDGFAREKKMGRQCEPLHGSSSFPALS